MDDVEPRAPKAAPGRVGSGFEWHVGDDELNSEMDPVREFEKGKKQKLLLVATLGGRGRV